MYLYQHHGTLCTCFMSCYISLPEKRGGEEGRGTQEEEEEKEKWQFAVLLMQQCHTLTYGNMSFSLMLAHMMRVISSPSISTTAFLATTRCPASERWQSHGYQAQACLITCTCSDVAVSNPLGYYTAQVGIYLTQVTFKHQ